MENSIPNILWDNLTGTTMSPIYDTDGCLAAQYYDFDFKHITFERFGMGAAHAKFIGPCSFATASRILREELKNNKSSYHIVPYKVNGNEVVFTILRVDQLYVGEGYQEYPSWFENEITIDKALYLITKHFKSDPENDDVMGETGCDERTSKLIWNSIYEVRKMHGDKNGD